MTAVGKPIIDECAPYWRAQQRARLDAFAAALQEVYAAGGIVATLRQQEPVPGWIQLPAPVGRAEQLHALDVLTTELVAGTDELDHRLADLTRVAFTRSINGLPG